MTAATAHTYAASFGASALTVLELESFSMDKDRVPYVAATVRIADPGDTLWNAMDPRATPAPFLSLTITSSVYNTADGTTNVSTLGPMKLWLLDADRDMQSGEATLRLSSGEFLLDDKINVTSTRTNTGATKLSELVAYALTQVGQTLAAFTGTTDTAYPVLDERRYWGPGETANELIETELNSVGSRLWCNEFGEFIVEGRGSLYPAVLRGLSSWFSIRQQRSRTGPWYDSSVILYEYTDSGGVNVHTHQNSSGPSSRGLFQTLNRPKPTANAAQQLADRSKLRGEQYVVEAAPTFLFRPGNAVLLGGVGTVGIRSIDWRLADGVMTMRMQS